MLFSGLANKLKDIWGNWTGEAVDDKKIEAMCDLLIDYDVSVSVAKKIMDNLSPKLYGLVRLESVSFYQQMMVMLHEEILQLLINNTGNVSPSSGVKAYDASLSLKGEGVVWMVCGLQGMGKTSSVVKIANFLSKTYNKKILIAACDTVRFGAVDQLKTLCKTSGIDCFHDVSLSAIDNAVAAKKYARENGVDLLLVDTAGRTQADTGMMNELADMSLIMDPKEILWVSSVMCGQSIIEEIKAFNERVKITGMVITMMDGSAKGGNCVSFVFELGIPIKFETFGENCNAISVFNAKSFVNRMLGLGDTINLVRRAKEVWDANKSTNMQEIGKRMFLGRMSFEDLITVGYMVNQMGGIKYIVNMLPGFSDNDKMGPMCDDDYKMLRVVVNSMTPAEKKGVHTIGTSRLGRISRGAGVSIEQCRKIVKMPDVLNKAVLKMKNRGFSMKGWGG